MVTVLIALGLGLFAGVMSGVFGIGGGVVVVPGLVLLLGYGQKTATGTSLLALILPVGVLALLSYAREGHVNVRVGLFVAAGIFAGSLAGARLALAQPDTTLRRAFAVLLALLALRLFVAS